LVHDADLAALRDAEVLRPLSQTVAGRLRHFLGLAAEPLYCPPPTPELLRCEATEGYLYFPGRLAPVKRHRLVLEALAQTASRFTLVVSGGEDEPGYARQLAAQADALGVADRVRWCGHVDDTERARLFARCQAVVFAPFQEDYGFVTLEAMLSGKPVVTTSDAGGPTEFVRHEATGLVAEPTPQGLAHAFDRLWQEAGLASELGRAGQGDYARREIGWDAVVRGLVP
jgi:glycosyltransferase involved in cell wall biosynthesis